MCTFTWFNFLIFLSGVFSGNSTTCVTPNLFDEFKDRFGKKDLNLKQIGDKYFKCLAMYVRDPQLVLNSTTMENIVRMDPSVDELAKYIIQQITDGDRLAHSDHFPAFMETCFYKSHLKTFGMLLGSFFRSNYKMKLTCPLGLLWDIICTFTSCLQSDCKVDGETCPSQQDSKESCRTSINLKLYCKSNFGSFLDSCVNDVNKYKDDLTKSLDDDLHNTDCSNFNYIYQGLTSLQVVEKSVIAADCHESDEGNVTMRCFKDGKYLRGATWNLDDTKDPSGSKGTLSISREDLLWYSNVSCYEDSVKLAEIVSKHTYQLCYSDKEEINVVNDIRNKRNAVNQTPSTEFSTSSVSPTTTSPEPGIIRKKWKDFYRNDKIWLFEESNGSLDGIDAFDNKKRLQTNVDKLTVPLVSVGGRLTPICGELWNKGAAEVFCRDAGAQLQQNWVVSYVGSLQKSKNERHHEGDFYKHYLRNITCKGDESNIIWCDHDGWYHHSGCTHDAVVICSEVKDDPPEPDPPAGAELAYIILGVIGGVSLLGILSSAFICIFGKRYPDKYESLRMKLLGICYHTINGPVPNDREEHTETITTVTAFMQQLSKSETDESVPGDSASQSYSFDGFGMDSNSVSRQVTYEESSNAFLHDPIQEDNLKRLNTSKAPEWVLKYEMEGETLVCKSFFKLAGETVDDMRTEQFFLSHVNHPNIVKCVGESREISFDNKMRHSFFMEHLTFGGLDKYLRGKDESGLNHGHLMTVEDATNVIIGICRALHYVHNLGYVHADISTDNFFAFKNDETGLLDVKLGDFESFYRPPTRVDGGRGWKHVRCTYLYSAPEIILDSPKDKSGSDIKKDAFKNDVWGLGEVLWELQSWIMCKNSKRSSKSGDPSNHAAPAQSSLIESMTSRFVKSRIRTVDDYTCRRHIHVAVLQKINIVNPEIVTDLPEKSLMEKFYKSIHPHNIGLPSMDPKLDKQFGWPIKGLLTKCLAINPTKRLSMKEVLEYLLKHANSNPGSPLSKYKTVLESDLNMRDNLRIDLEDVEPIDLDDPVYPAEMFSPPTLQPNLGQLHQMVYTQPNPV